MRHTLWFRRIIILAAVLFSNFHLSAQNKYQGHLWEITGNGLTRPSYLFGTMHVSSKVAFHLGDPFYDAIQSCDFIALELEPDLWMHDMFKGDYMEKMLGKTFGRFGGGRNGQFNGNFKYEPDLERQIKEILKSNENISNYMLSRSMMGNEDFEEDSWLDMHIYQCAKKMNKKSFGLETFSSSMSNLTKATASKQFSDRDPEDYENLRAMESQMESAYRRGDLDFVDSLSRLSYPGESHKYMLVNRNNDFVHTIDSLLKHGNVFAAMGCAHLPGEDGVIEMLRAMGYQIKAVDKGNHDAKRKAEIEKKLLVRPTQHYVSKDKLLSFEAPSEVYSIGVGGYGIVYMSLDMPNGGTFMIQRSASWPVTFGLTTNEMADKIESMLYENIPGEIISQKRINWKGYPAFDVVNKNNKGDIGRALFIVADAEIIKISVLGPGEIVKKGYGKFFFDKFNLANSKEKSEQTKHDIEKTATNIYSLKEFNFFDNKLTISLAGQHFKQEADLEMKMGNLLPEMVENPVKNEVYIIQRGELQTQDYIDENAYELSEFARYFFNQLDVLPNDQTNIKIGDAEAIRCNYLGYNDKKTEALFIASGNDYYAIQVVADDPKSADEIFSTVRLNPAPSPTAFYELRDSTLRFTAMVPWEQKDEDDDIESMFSGIGSRYINSEDKYKGKDMGDYKSNEKEYKDPEEKYNIEVSTERFLKYLKWEKGKPSDEIILSKFNPEQDYIVSHKSVTTTPKGIRVEFVFTDTASVRAQRILVIQDDMTEYVVRYVNDSDKIFNPFVNKFMESFTPIADSVTGGHSFAEDKFEMQYKDLQSPDSSTYQFANEFIFNLDVNTPERIQKIKELGETLSPVATKEEKESMKTRWHQYLYLDKSKENINFLKSEYNNASDSAVYQVAILNNLSMMQTKESRLVLKELLLKDTPLVDYPEFIYGLNDSVEKIVKIIPQLLELTQFEEYKMPLYYELGEALDSNAVSGVNYATHVSNILRSAKIELKKTASLEDTETPRISDYDYYEEDNEAYISDLKTYLTLLHPHKTNQEVAAFFKQVEEHKKLSVNWEYAQFLVRKKLPVPDPLARKFIKEDSRISTVEDLVEINRLDVLPSNWNIQEEQLKDYIKMNGSGYGDDNNAKIDSILIDSTFTDHIKYRKYNIYFMRAKAEGSSEWNYWVGFVRTDIINATSPISFDYGAEEISDKPGFNIYDIYAEPTTAKSKKPEKTTREKQQDKWLDMKFSMRNNSSYDYDSGYGDW
jgi:uncharacterized protein YbaP (TraB family)